MIYTADVAAAALETFRERLDTRQDAVDSDGVRVGSKGKLSNFKVDMDDRRIYLNGSLTKFFHGHNLLPLHRDEMRQALKKLIEVTGLPIYKARLNRIDVAVNVFVQEKPTVYFHCLEDTPGYLLEKSPVRRRYVVGTKERLREFCFYDKMSELQRFDRDLYEELKGMNIIRIEDRYRKRAKRQLLPKKKSLLVGHLLSNVLQRKLWENWLEHYHEIVKTQQTVMSLNVQSFTDIRNTLAAKGIEAVGGIAKVIAYVDEVVRFNGWSNDNGKGGKTKTAIRELVTQQFEVTKPAAVMELDHEVANSEQLKSWRDELF